MCSFVYVITNLINLKSYIGKSNKPEERFRQHIRSSSFGKSQLSRAILKYGEHSFEFKVVGKFQSEEEAYNYEKLLIESCIAGGRELYNLAAGGKGILMTPALKTKMETVWRDPKRLQKISDSSKRNWSNASFRSRISSKIECHFKNAETRARHGEATRVGMTLESRKKISDTHKGRVQSAEERSARSTGCLRYWTEEKRLEHSRKLMRENNPNAKLCRRDVIKCRVLSELFTISASQIARILSLPNKATRNAINGETWKDVLLKDENGNLTDESFTAFFELLGEFMNISPSAKTNQRVRLSPFGESIPKVLAAYENWKITQ